MIGTYTTAAVICAASLLVGRAIFVLAGRDAWSWLEPAVGLAAILTVAGIGARLPDGGTWAGILVGVLILASLPALRRPYSLRGTEAGVPVLIVIALVLGIPFLVEGHWGLIGVGFNDDLGLHLAWAEWLRSGFGPTPDSGYPLGPHGLAIAASNIPSVDLGQAFVGEIIAITALTGLTALAALGDLGRARRTLAAVMVAIPYLAASYFAQAAFKETAEAMFVLTFAIALPFLLPLPPAAAGPLAVITTGIYFSYSFAGIAWPAAILLLWSLTFPAVRRALAPRVLLRKLARPLTLLWIVLGAAALVFLVFVGPFGFASELGRIAATNTYGPVSPVEAFGVWPAADYRLDGVGGAPFAGVAVLIGALALIVGLVWWIRRRELAVPIAFGACLLLYLASLPFSGDYSRAKALMIGSPLVMLIAARALLAGPGAGWQEALSGRLPELRRVAWGALTVLFFAGAIYSSLLVLRDTSVGPPGHGAELQEFLPTVEGKSVLYAGQDRFAAYELLGADTHVPLVEFPDDLVEQNPTKPFSTGFAYAPIDFDSFTADTLNNVDYVVTSGAAWNSRAPKGFERVDSTDSYILWKRTEELVRESKTLLEGTEAGALVDCRQPETKLFTEHLGVATVFPKNPVLGSKESWDPGSVLGTGDSTSQSLYLTAGRWRLSIQYFSPFRLTLKAKNQSRSLIPALDGQRPNTISLANDGQYWPAGVYKQKTTGPVTFTVSAADPTTIQKLSGYDGKAYLGKLVAVPQRRRTNMQLNQTCGRWLDNFRGASFP
jgi:hypothetical protein